MIERRDVVVTIAASHSGNIQLEFRGEQRPSCLSSFMAFLSSFERILGQDLERGETQLLQMRRFE
jgi:hypothetical protein